MTKHQKEVFDKLQEDPSRVVVFTGAGGTGKTTTIAKFIKSLPASVSVMLTSTTHQAMSVLREMIPRRHACSVSTSTIHKFLDYVVMNVNGKEVLRKNEDAAGSYQASYDYLIIDEMSMLPREILKEIMDGDLDDRIRSKIIFVGDPCQLKVDMFLDFSRIPTYELEENMRQDKDSELYKYCDELRSSIKKNGSPIMIPGIPGEIDIYYSHDKFLSEYKKCETDKVILAYMNKTVSAYNRNIKKYVHKKSLYSEGDKIIVTGPVKRKTPGGKSVSIFNNRERLTIKRVKTNFNEVTEPDEVDPMFEIEHTELDVVNSKGKSGTIYVPKTKTKLDKLLEEYKLKRDWSNFYKLKETYNFVHHSYALTTYMAQGSTYEEVFIDLSDFTPPNDPAYQTLMSLVYVAMTRAKKRVHIYMGDSSARDYGSLEKDIS